MPAGTDRATADFFVRSLVRLREAGVDFLVGGAYALNCHAGVERHTRDFDVFVRERDAEAALAALAPLCDRTELTFPHWLGKAYRGEMYVDVIFNSGNGVCAVDDEWFDHAIDSTVFGQAVRLVPIEEMIWQKAFIMERERFDGADVLHMLRASGERIDWARLLRRFGPHWRLLFAHLVLFGFVYPGEQDAVPARVMAALAERLRRERDAPASAGGPPSPNGQRLCHGTLLSREQYLCDLELWGYQDARLLPPARMSAEEIAEWTAAIATR
jgi:hypothetical protein